MSFLFLLQLLFPAASVFATSSSILPPSNVTYQALSADDIKLSWDPVFGANGYKIYEITDGQLLLTGTVTNATYTKNNLAEGSYRYVVSTLSAEGESGPSAPITVTIDYPDMLPPSTLNASIQNGNDIVISWGSAQNAQSYNLYKIDVNGVATLLKSGIDRTFTITRAPEGTYKFAVTSVHTVYGESAQSTIKQIDLVYPIMTAPNNFTASVTNLTDVNLSWDPVSNAMSYKIYQITDGNPVLKSTVSGTTVKYSNVLAGDYSYEVHSYSDRFGESSTGSSVSITVGVVTMLPPSNFAHKIQNGNDIILTWTSAANANSYKIYQIIDGQRVLKSTVTGTTVTYSNMPAGNYTYEIHSVSTRFGESADGSQDSFTLDPIAIVSPSSLSYQLQNINDIILTWDSAVYADSYNVYQVIDGVPVLKSTVTGTTVTFTKMPGGDYSYIVKSISSRFGESTEGSTISFHLESVTMFSPSNVTYQLQNGNDIVLSWPSAANANSYKVYQIVNGQRVLKSSIPGKTVTYTNMPVGDYSYEVHSFSTRFGESADGSQVSFTLSPISMQPPGNLTYTIQNLNDIVLSWDSANLADSYKVYQIVDGTRVLNSTVTDKTVTFTRLPAGNYTYEVHAVSSRFGESVEGSQLSVTLEAVIMNAPANFSYTINDVNTVVLKWDAAPNATGYKVYQISGGQEVLKSSLTGTSVSYSDLPAGSYQYKVYAVSNRFGTSPMGTSLTLEVVFPTMQPPTNFTSTITTPSSVTLSWTAVDYATSYKVYQIVGGNKVLKSTVTGTSVSYTSLPPGEYSYVVHSSSSRFGDSAEGSQLSLTLDGVTMQAPTNVTSTITIVTDVTLKWTVATNATKYKIYEVVDGQKVLKNTVSSATASFTGLSAGDHNFMIHSFSTLYGESAEGAAITVSIVYPVITPPSNLVYKIQKGNDIVLTWGTASNADSYNIYELINNQKVLLKSGLFLTTTLTNVAEGMHTYIVQTVNNRFGESQEGSLITVPLQYPNMEAPGNLTTSLANGNDLTLQWNTVPYATAYKVYQIINGQKVLKSTVTNTTVTYPNTAAGALIFEVYSYSDRFGESAAGSQVSLTLDYQEMLAPVNLIYSISNGNNISLKWDAVSYSTSYKVYQVIDGQKVLKRTVTDPNTLFSNMPEGPYTYVVHSYSDRFGESKVGSQVDFNLIFPVMQSPINLVQSITNFVDINLSWKSSTYANSYNVYRVIDNQKVLLTTTTSTSTILNNMPQGNYTIEVHSYSNRFGESPDGSKINFDLIYPVMQAPTNLTYSITKGNDIVLKWDAVTYAGSYKIYKVQDGQKTLVKSVTGISGTFINMPEGPYQYEVNSVNDTFGESPKSAAIQFNLVWPIVQPPVLKDTVYNANNVTLTWNAVTWANEYRVYHVLGETRELLYKGTDLTYPIYNLTQDAHSYEVTAFSTRFGESAASNRVTESIVYPTMQPPVAALNLVTATSARITWNFITYANGYNVYEIIDGKPVLLINNLNNLSYTVSNLSNADHKYYVTSLSNSFGESTPSNTVVAKLILDTVPPVTTAQASTDWSNQSQQVSLTATDNDSGVYKTYYSIDDQVFIEGTSILVADDGTHKITFYSVDKAGNIETAKSIWVKVDKTKPVTRSNAPTEWSKEAVAVKLIATDSGSGVAKTFYAVNGTDFVEGTSFVVDKEGVNQISFYSVDAVGNVESAKTAEVKIDRNSTDYKLCCSN
ncbi:OmpL47-type beta-barrel domain-containing protein [Paenibacillus roseipurpureus]|uniref:Fibronectin type-III domain-containing protein n=1 Tax=Paenibacillus roseopurpureus TaxID=2918901 RepID=A0AA96LP50_9BACL|nr:hypothetical protein [Paenibacillus sp. MBLB1832]WNR44701.1 hypothetical protein MJB10_00600 [Paenibacillus sp. MBLB1832]